MSQVNSKIIFEKKISSLAEFHELAREIAQNFSLKSVVALSGSLGAGKTEFVKVIGQARGFQGVASPTFAIHHRYQEGDLSFDHLDLYRLESEDELETTGFWDLFAGDQGLIFIEWPERMNLSHIPHDWDLWLVEITKLSEGERRISVSRRD